MLFELLVLVASCYILYKLFGVIYPSQEGYWKDRGVLEVDATHVVSNWDVLLGKKDITLRDDFAYDAMSRAGETFCGMIETGNKLVLLKDLNLIKKIFIKDFENFMNRRDIFAFLKPGVILKKMLNFTAGQDWKDLRTTVSPIFTTGKIRKMMSAFNEVGKEWTDSLKAKAKSNNNGSVVVNVGAVVNTYTVDVISQSVFAMKAGSIKDPDSVFFKMAVRFGNFDGFKIILGAQFPRLARLFNLQVFDLEAVSFFERILGQGLKSRMDGTVKGNDFLQLLVDAKKGELKAAAASELSDFEKDATIKGPIKTAILTDDYLNAQSLMFFIAGFSTTTNFISAAMYALAAHMDVQEKLRKEVEGIVKGNGDVDYDDLGSLQYMDMFVQEVLRFFPAAARLERVCLQDYHDPETGLKVPKGAVVGIPVRALHFDKQYYSHADTLHPEHFTPEEKAKRNPYAHLPFGLGPRNCIGMRFALMESKTAIAHLLHEFIIEPAASTPLPLKGVPAGFQVLPPPDLELKLTPRKK